MVSPIIALHELRRLLREVTALGVTFRISGTEVCIEGADSLPADLRAALDAARAAGLLFVTTSMATTVRTSRLPC
jgi:hypothetical protein